MGASFCTVFERAVPPYGSLGGDHRGILGLRVRLAHLADEVGLTPLEAFESYAPEDTHGLLDEEDQEDRRPAEWFPAGDCLAAINALWEYLKAHPSALPRQAEVMEDLSDLGDEVEAAQRAGVRVRFAVVM